MNFNFRFVIALALSSMGLASNALAKTVVIGFQMDHCTRDSTRSSEIDTDSSFRFEKIFTQISDISNIEGLSAPMYCNFPAAKTAEWVSFDTTDANAEVILQKYDGKKFATPAGEIDLVAKSTSVVAEIRAAFTNPDSIMDQAAIVKFNSIGEALKVAEEPFPRSSEVGDVCVSTMRDHFRSWDPSLVQPLETFFKTWRGPGQNVGWKWDISFLDASGHKMPYGRHFVYAEYWALWGSKCSQSNDGHP